MKTQALGRRPTPGHRGRLTPVLVALSLVGPATLVAQNDPLRILGFRRQPSPRGVELVLACSAPVSFRYSSPTLETIRLVLPGLDPTGVTPPREAWGEDLASVELGAATGSDAPGAVLELTLPEFRPYSLRAVGNELRISLEGPEADVMPAMEPLPPRPVPMPTPDPTPEPAPPAAPDRAPEVDAATEPPPDAGAADEVAMPETGPVAAASAAPLGAEDSMEPLPESDAEADLAPGSAASEPAEPESAGPEPAEPPPPIEPDFFEGIAPEPPDAATEPDVAPPPAEADAPTATRIFEVAREDEGGALALRVPANGRPSYQAFFTEEGPLRLVIDLEGAESRPLFQRLDVGVGPVRRVRVGQHQAEPVPIVRVVIDLDERVSHRIEADADGLTIRFEGMPVEP